MAVNCEFLPTRRCQLAKWIGKVQNFIQQRKRDYLDEPLGLTVMQRTNDTTTALMEYLKQAEEDDITSCRAELSMVKLCCKNDAFQVVIFVDMTNY